MVFFQRVQFQRVFFQRVVFQRVKNASTAKIMLHNIYAYAGSGEAQPIEGPTTIFFFVSRGFDQVCEKPCINPLSIK